MKRTAYIACAAIALFHVSCGRIHSAMDAERASAKSVVVNISSALAAAQNTEGLNVVFERAEEGIRVESTLDGGATVTVRDLAPGIYAVYVFGRVQGSDGKTYYLNGNRLNHAVLADGGRLEIEVDGLAVSPLVFSQIYYAGTTPFYFRDQFVEIYNNSDETIYLDGLHFAHLTPIIATTNLPKWPEADGEKYVYGDRVWKVPGAGTDYPLAPGESFSIAQFAANHQLPNYNPASPIDCTPAEFEFNMDNANFPDMPAVNMAHVFYNGSASKGTIPQYLISVFGGAYVIFRVPEGDTYDPVGDPTMRTTDLKTSSTKQYAKIPREWIMDAVECGHNESKIAEKRMPAGLDGGMTWVSAIYNSLGVVRKAGASRPDGSPILQDTNNSTEDFERGVVPRFRPHEGMKMPKWNHTLH